MWNTDLYQQMCNFSHFPKNYDIKGFRINIHPLIPMLFILSFYILQNAWNHINTMHSTLHAIDILNTPYIDNISTCTFKVFQTSWNSLLPTDRQTDQPALPGMELLSLQKISIFQTFTYPKVPKGLCYRPMSVNTDPLRNPVYCTAQESRSYYSVWCQRCQSMETCIGMKHNLTINFRSFFYTFNPRLP